MEKMDQAGKDYCLNEIRLQAALPHTNIVEYKEAFVSVFGGFVCIVMEYCEEGDL